MILTKSTGLFFQDPEMFNTVMSHSIFQLTHPLFLCSFIHFKNLNPYRYCISKTDPEELKIRIRNIDCPILSSKTLDTVDSSLVV